MLPPDVAVATLRGRLGDPRAALARAEAAAQPHGSEVQLVRAEAVVSEAHLASAALHARRAVAEGRARAQSLGLEFLRYLAGERQIARAIATAGLAPEGREAIAVALGGDPRAALSAVARALAVDVVWALPAARGDERAALERVALLDLER
ncbi:MAG TPA: KEOPS complex subunit Cgi121 [Candidatus Thermoplasmatota archaeon]|jgi:tRNA threonylcarbamoyladenosine modification (KEOPS) complex Cgi121 subunit|nr:KEOPS complex subunit Cgi121 [Candidatus Thermoplasmatota archaeon]